MVPISKTKIDKMSAERIPPAARKPAAKPVAGRKASTCCAAHTASVCTRYKSDAVQATGRVAASKSATSDTKRSIAAQGRRERSGLAERKLETETKVSQQDLLIDLADASEHPERGPATDQKRRRYRGCRAGKQKQLRKRAQEAAAGAAIAVISTTSKAEVTVSKNQRQEQRSGNTSLLTKLTKSGSNFVSARYFRDTKMRTESELMAGLDWRLLPETCVAFERVSSSLTAKDLWKVFSPFGTISAITIDQDTEGLSRGKGLIRFNPPPNFAFWIEPKSVAEFKKGHLAEMKLSLRQYRLVKLPGLINTEHQYPHIVQIELAHLSVGVLLNSKCMLNRFDAYPFPSFAVSTDNLYSYRPLTLAINLEHREIHLTFPVHFHDPSEVKEAYINRTEIFRLTIPLQQRIQAFRNQSSRGTDILTIAVETPPACFRRGDEVKSMTHNSHRWNENDSLYRQVDVVLNPRSTRVKKKPISLRQDDSIINLSQWTCYSVEIKKDVSAVQYEQLFSCLHDHNIQVQECPDFRFTSDPHPTVWDYIDPPGSHGSNEAASSSLKMLTSVAPLDFQVRYQLEVCISGGWLNEYNLSEEFVSRLRSMETSKACALLECVAADKSEQKSRRILNPMSVFDLSAPPSVLNKKRPDYCSIIRSATITPTTVIVNTPSCEISNRVIRHYSEHADRFLRVRFLDEKNRGRIYSSVGKNTMNEIFTRVFRSMSNGIVIGDRKYEFLAFGNSQFRENGAYFFAPTASLNAQQIRAWMGNFEHIKIVAKYAARLGQCFSTTRAMKSVKPIVKEIPDIERNGYVFTDGVGKISPHVAMIASQDFKIPMRGGVPPSVFQFRLGGSKGILSVWPDVKGLEVHVRPSQKKFTAAKNDLEIIRWSQASEFSLNRQIILVLSALGVPDQIFNDKLQIQLKSLNDAMTDEQVAKRALNSSIDVNGTTLTLAGMVHDGFQTIREPFMMTMLRLWRAWSIKVLKEKAKIHIPNGAVLLGCTDETGTLKGHFNRQQHKVKSPSWDERISAIPEVFVQLSNYEGSGHSRTIEGLMIIARNPSLHAGDIRVVKGVNIPALAHMKDCLVLPQTGDRDVANMCSGGDLDGDDFIVSWDAQLIPKEWNAEPMDFTPVQPYVKDKGVTVEDIMGFFVQYMKNADLGNIAYAHLATADQEPEGVKSSRCIKLAKIHSDAVDYPKSGRPANIPEYLKPKRYPHFMERKRGGYMSYKILGQLYNSVKLVDFNPAYDNPFDKRILNAYNCGEDMLEAARVLKEQYDLAIRRIMAQHGIRTEFEVWSTFAMERNKNYGDFKFGEILGESVLALKEQFRELCIEKAGSRDLSNLAPFVAAMYIVTNEQMCAALDECNSMTWDANGRPQPRREKLPGDMPLMSFPWLFPTVLGMIAKNTLTPAFVAGEEVRLPTKTDDLQMKPDTDVGEQPENKAGGILADTTASIVENTLEEQVPSPEIIPIRATRTVADLAFTLHPIRELSKPQRRSYLGDLIGLTPDDSVPKDKASPYQDSLTTSISQNVSRSISPETSSSSTATTNPQLDQSSAGNNLIVLDEDGSDEEEGMIVSLPKKASPLDRLAALYGD